MCDDDDEDSPPLCDAHKRHRRADIIRLNITGKDARHAAQEVRTLCSRYPEVDQMLVHFLFR